jgi:hypothetical protein
MLQARGFRDPVPGGPQVLPEVFGEGDGEPDVEVRNTPRLKLQNPEITDTRCCAPKSFQPGVQVLLASSAIGKRLVVGQAELRNESRVSVPRHPSET